MINPGTVLFFGPVSFFQSIGNRRPQIFVLLGVREKFTEVQKYLKEDEQ